MTDTVNTQKKSIKGTQTEKNLAAAYVAESCAYSRYTFFADQAKKESYFQISDIFNETAANELHHAKIFFRMMDEENVECPAQEIDAGVIGKTEDNLAVAASEEQKEGVEQYKNAAEVARKEGFPDIAARFEAIATIEAHHEARFRELRERILNGTLWKRETPIKWQCLVCGYIFEGVQPPQKCPACQHPYQHFMPAEENY